MAWDGWLDTLVKFEGTTHGAIMGQDGSTWASSPGLNITQSEIESLKGIFRPAKELPPSFTVSGQKYLTIRSLDDVIDGKLKGNVVSVAQTGKAMVFAIYTPTDANDSAPYVSQKLNAAASYLKSQLLAVNY